MEAVAAAQDELNASIKEYEEYQKRLELDKKINDLEDAKNKTLEKLNAEIDRLKDLKKQWSESLDIAEDTTKYKNLLDDMEKFENASYENRLDMLDEFVAAYKKLMQEMEDYAASTAASISSSMNSAAASASALSGIYVSSPGAKKPSGGTTSGNKNPDTGTGGSGIEGTSKWFEEYVSNESQRQPSSWSSSTSSGYYSGGGAGTKGNSVSQADWDDMNFASGTQSVPRTGVALVGENGPELRTLNRGDGIIPADLTKNLMAWGQFTPSDIIPMALRRDFASGGGSAYSFQFGELILPNVTDYDSFVMALKEEGRNIAMQVEAER